MQPKLLKYILDIESVIEEIELIKQKAQNDFNNFSDDIILQRAVERDLEIIGEAIRKINIISHAYDSVEPEMLWGIIQKNIPVLATEIRNLKNI